MAEQFFEDQPSSSEIESRMEGFPSWLEIDLDRLSFNLESIRRFVGGVEVIPCVKTNAYGHGLVPVVAQLSSLGVNRVLVAKTWEAMQIRSAGLDCGVINMDPLFSRRHFESAVSNDLTQSIFSEETARQLSQAAVGLGRDVRVFIKVDTGLGRVGVRYDKACDLVQAASSMPRLGVDGIFSTFSEAPSLDRIQLDRMHRIIQDLERRGLPVPIVSMASSNAICHFQESHLDAVRPGIMLLGVYPEEEDQKVGPELRQILTFKGRLELVKWIEAGESLTYSRRFVAQKRMKVGTVHAGYSDGYPRGLTNKGRVRVGQLLKPVLGSVSVNHHVVDLDDTDVEVGDVVELIGRNSENSISSLAALAGIMTYSLCVGLNPLTPRVYFRGKTAVALSEPKLVEKS